MPTVIDRIDKYITESGKVQKKLIKEDIIDNDLTADIIDLLNSLDDSVLDDTQLILKDRILSSVDGLDDLEINLDDVDDVEDVDGDELDQVIDEPVPETIDDLDFDLDDLDYVGEETDKKKKRNIKSKLKIHEEVDKETLKKQIKNLRAKKKKILDADYDTDSEGTLEQIDKQIESLSKKLYNK